MTLGTNFQFSPRTLEMVKAGQLQEDKLQKFRRLVDRIESQLLPHKVITNNQFTGWFKNGNFDLDDCRHFLVQFSVFSNLFIIAQLKKTLNAPSLEAMRAGKEILMNELGVVFRNPKKSGAANAVSDQDQDSGLIETEGTVEGGTFHFRAAHFEWLLRMLSHLGLSFEQVGKRKHGTESTLFFCDELSRLYGSDDPHVGLGASFAVENWAAAGFWKELISGLKTFRERECPQLPIGFFTWHDMIEDQHKQHTWDELEEDYFSIDLDEEKFFQGAGEMLNGVLAFWDGLNNDRLKRDGSRKLLH